MDRYRCGDCQAEFSSYEQFLIHKMLWEQYKLVLREAERIPGLRLPEFVKVPKTTNKEETSKTDNLIVRMVTETEIESANLHKEIVEIIESDNSSVSSKTESLRIDESVSAKENDSSPVPDGVPKSTVQLYCKICDRYYKNKFVLIVHNKTVHSAARPYKCPTCRQGFKTKGSLVRHVRTHTGEKPFHCQKCGRGFIESWGLSRHLYLVHKRPRGALKPNDFQVFVTRMATEATEESK